MQLFHLLLLGEEEDGSCSVTPWAAVDTGGLYAMLPSAEVY